MLNKIKSSDEPTTATLPAQVQSPVFRILFCFLMGFSLQTYAKPKNCRAKLADTQPVTIFLYPTLTRDVEKALKKSVPELGNSPLGYLLSALFDAVVNDNGYDQADYKGLPFKALKKMPHEIQIEFFTRLKHHPLLYENPPATIDLVSKGGTPQYLSKLEREAVLKTMGNYDLPDLEMQFLKLSPIKESDLSGKTLELYFASNIKATVSYIDFADDGEAIVHSDGQVLAAGPWSLENGFLIINSTDQIRIDLRRATPELLHDAFTDVSRIHDWGPFAYMQIRYLDEDLEQAVETQESN